MTDRRDTGLEPACSLGMHQHCAGTLYLKAGPGPALPLQRCSCACHRGRVRVQVTRQAKRGG